MKAINNTVLLLSVMVLSGCGAYERATATFTGYSEICVDGVTYLQFTSGVTVAYNQDGSIKKCQ